MQAAYHGVPLVAMPFFADQHLNALKAVNKVHPLPYTSLWHEFNDGLLQPNTIRQSCMHQLLWLHAWDRRSIAKFAPSQGG